MRKITLLVILAFAGSLSAQTAVSKGSIGVGFHAACPQSELKDIEYDEGWGLNLSYLTRKYPYKSPYNFQVGARMDFANMQSKSFDVALATPVADDGVLKVKNSMFGFLGLVRVNFNDQNKVVPFVNLLAGSRSYTTSSSTTAQHPERNPEYESVSLTPRLVHTNRFHYGGSVGVSYQVSEKFSVESSVTYTFGEAGSVLPLKDVTQRSGGNEIKYDFTQSAKTDILLINLGVRFELFKRYKSTTTGEGTSTTPTSTSPRYKDKTTTPTKVPDPVIKDKPKKETTPPKEKIPIEIKPDRRKPGGEVKH